MQWSNRTWTSKRRSINQLRTRPWTAFQVTTWIAASRWELAWKRCGIRPTGKGNISCTLHQGWWSILLELKRRRHDGRQFNRNKVLWHDEQAVELFDVQWCTEYQIQRGYQPNQLGDENLRGKRAWDLHCEEGRQWSKVTRLGHKRAETEAKQQFPIRRATAEEENEAPKESDLGSSKGRHRVEETQEKEVTKVAKEKDQAESPTLEHTAVD